MAQSFIEQDNRTHEKLRSKITFTMRSTCVTSVVMRCMHNREYPHIDVEHLENKQTCEKKH